MVWTIVCLIIIVVLVILSFGAVVPSWKHNRLAILCAVFACVFLGLLAFFVAPQELGYGHIDKYAGKFTKRFEVGVIYRFVASDKTACRNESKAYSGIVTNQIVLANKSCTQEFIVGHVEEAGPIPPFFTLIGGKPVAIDPPTCTK